MYNCKPQKNYEIVLINTQLIYQCELNKKISFDISACSARTMTKKRENTMRENEEER